MRKFLLFFAMLVALALMSCSYGLSKPITIDLDCLPADPPPAPQPPPDPQPPYHAIFFGLSNYANENVNITTAPSYRVLIPFTVHIDNVEYLTLATLPDGWSIEYESSTPLVSMNIWASKFTAEISGPVTAPGVFTMRLMWGGFVYGEILVNYI